MASNLPPLPPSKHNIIAAWLFGSLLLLFFIWIFVFGPDKLPAYKQQMLAIFAALLCALFTFFFVGSLQIQGKWKKLAIRSGGGLAVFIFVMIWWNVPQITPIIPIPDNITIDHESLSILKPTGGISTFTGTVKPPELCQQLRVLVKNKGGHACSKREPICSNGNWKINCSQEIESFEPGQYEITAISKNISVSDKLEIIDNNKQRN